MGMDLLEITEKIRVFLRLHPEGLSITSIASQSEINRNTLVKYLGIMQSQGSVGMRQVGVAKVYYLADRIPISAVRRFCRHYVIVDHILDLVETSASLPVSLGMPAGERTSRRVCDQFPGLRGIPNLQTYLRSALRDEEQTIRWSTGRHQGNRVFTVSFIPTVLESGRPAASLVLDDVTESDRNGNEGELDKLRSQALFEDQSEYVVRLSPDGYIRWANPGYCRMTDQTMQSLFGQRFRPPAVGDEREEWDRQLRSLTAANPVSTIECHVGTRNKPSRWQHWTLRGLHGPSGTLLEYQLVGHDISGYMATRDEFLQCKEKLDKQASARKLSLQESKIRYYEDIACRERVETRSWFARFALENSTDGICWIDGSGRIFYANRALCGSLGYAQDELQSMHYAEIDTRCNRESFERMWKILRREGRCRIQSTLRRIDRTFLPAEITALHLELNGMRYCCAYIRIFPEAAMPDRVLWENGEVFRKAFEESPTGSPGGLLDEIVRSIPDAVFAVDRRGRVIAWNQTMEKMTGIRAADMLGKGNYEYALPFYRERVPMLIDRAAGTGTAPGDGYTGNIGEEDNCLTAERAISPPDGYSRIILEKAVPIYGSAGEVFGAIEFVHDISILRHTQDLLKRERRFNTAVLEAVDALIVVADDDSRIVWCNEQYRTLIECTRQGAACMGPGGTEQPFVDLVPATAGEQLSVRWSHRAFTQPGVGRFDIYTGILPVAGETGVEPYERTEE